MLRYSILREARQKCYSNIPEAQRDLRRTMFESSDNFKVTCRICERRPRIGESDLQQAGRRRVLLPLLNDGTGALKMAGDISKKKV